MNQNSQPPNSDFHLVDSEETDQHEEMLATTALSSEELQSPDRDSEVEPAASSDLAGSGPSKKPRLHHYDRDPELEAMLRENAGTPDLNEHGTNGYFWYQERDSWLTTPMSQAFKTAVEKGDNEFLIYVTSEFPEPAYDGSTTPAQEAMEYVDAQDHRHEKFIGLEDGPTALYMAAKSGNVDFATRLLELGADPDHHVTSIVDDYSTTSRGGTATLTAAVAWNHYEMAELLLRHNANPNQALKDGLALLVHTVNSTPQGSWITGHETDNRDRRHFAPLLVHYGARIEYPGRHFDFELSKHPFSSKEDYFQALLQSDVPVTKLPVYVPLLRAKHEWK